MGCTLFSYSQSIEVLLTGKINSVVDQSGSGDYTTVQDAINAVPDSNPDRTVIFIRNGVYHEKIDVPYQKINITLIGEDVYKTFISYNDNNSLTPTDQSFKTHTFCANADNFTALNITFENTSGNRGQALAFSSYGDKQIFYHCRFLGYQDTYFINYRCRDYMKDCFIEGATDFIYGFGIGVYDSCLIHSSRTGTQITAAATSSFIRFGLTFRDCRLTGSSGVSGVYLGRPWHNKPHVAYITCYEPSIVAPAGWTNMNSGLNPIFAEYNCTGPGFIPASRSTNPDYPGIQLTAEQASKYASLDTIFAAASFAKPEQDTLEEKEMYTHFDEVGLHDLIMYVMKRGRDTFPEIPTDDWNPMIDTNQLIQVVKENFLPFMDSSYCLQPELLGMTVDGVDLEGFSADKHVYGFELPEGDTVPPVIEVTANNSEVKIFYPGILPGYSTVYLYSRDHVTYSTYWVYNSIDSAYWNPEIDIIKYAYKIGTKTYTDTILVEKGTYEYDVEIPAAATTNPTVSPIPAVLSQTFKITNVTSMPDTAYIKSYAPDTNVSQIYTINFTLGVGVKKIQQVNNYRILDNPFKDKIRIEVKNTQNTDLQFTLFDMSGRIILTNKFNTSGSESGIIELDGTSIREGSYIYTLEAGGLRSSGKLIKLK